MRIRYITLCSAIVAGAFLLGRASAQDNKKKPPMQAPPWAQTTEQHKELAASVGEWVVDGHMWMAPGMPPQKFPATATRATILDGKYVQETFRGEFMGRPFEGRLIQGYDPVAKEYVSIWMDNFNPVPSVSRGREKDGVVTLEAVALDMTTGKMKKIRQTVKAEGPDRLSVAMFDVNPDGTGRMVMRLAYERKK